MGGVSPSALVLSSSIVHIITSRPAFWIGLNTRTQRAHLVNNTAGKRLCLLLYEVLEPFFKAQTLGCSFLLQRRNLFVGQFNGYGQDLLVFRLQEKHVLCRVKLVCKSRPMTITLPLEPQKEAKLIALAQAKGVSAGDLV